MDLPVRPLLRLEAPVAGLVVVPGAKIAGHGYVFSAARVAEITVFVGGGRLCAAASGLSRGDVTELYPDNPKLRPEGFAFAGTLPSTLPPGPAELVVIVRTASGESREAIAITVSGPGHIAPSPRREDLEPPVPQPAILPEAQAALIHAVEDAQLSATGLLTVRGWATGFTQVERVEVFGPEGILGVARLGLMRKDVAAANPGYPDAARAGFRFEQLAEVEALTGASLRVVIHAQGLPPRLVVMAVQLVDGAPIAEAEPEPALPASRPAAVTPPPMLLRLEEMEVNGAGILKLRGWVVGLSPIDQIRVHLGEALLGVAEKGVSRADVGAAHPVYPESDHAGFLFQCGLDETATDGQTVRVTARMTGGITRQATETLRLAAPIRRVASADATVHFHCDEVTLTEAGDVAIKGWSFCASGLAGIAVELDGETIGEALIGRERPDVGNAYPAIPSARVAGFQFSGRTKGEISGEQVLRVIVTGKGGEARVVMLPVLASPVMTVASAGQDGGNGIRFYLDTPQIAPGQTGNFASEKVRGFMSLAGWALAPAGIAGVEVFVDGASLGEAYYGIRREDIGAAFPTIESALQPGFAMLVPPQVLRRGRHDVRLIVRDKAGASAEIAFEVEAEPATDAPGPWKLREKMVQSEQDLNLRVVDAAGVRPVFALRTQLATREDKALAHLADTLESLRRQVYSHWSLEVVTPPQADPAAVAAQCLALQPELAGRVRFVAEAAAPDLRSHVFTGPLTAGDLLSADALMELAVATSVWRGADFLYADERRIDPSDNEMKAFFKPDWAPDLLLSTNYIGRIWVARGDLLARADLTEYRCEYGLVLALTEQAQRIAHVPKVLCERRSKVLDQVPEERAALRAALKRRGIRGAVEPGCIPGTHRVRRRVAVKGLVSIIITTVATRGLIKICLDSIRAHSTYRNFEFICLDNIAEANIEWKSWLAENADQALQIKEKFNWSRFNNKGAEKARGEFLLFLNDDIEVLPEHADWLECLLEHAQRPDVGVVGPQLLYPDRKVQHAGMFLADGVARHCFRFSGKDEPGPFGLARTQRNVTAVTGACYLVRRDVFDELGGFDETHSVINNDLDFCLRVQRSGRHVIFTPHTTLIHHEMVSRAKIRDIYNAKKFAAAWQGMFLKGDRYFSPHLSSEYDDYIPEAEPTTVVHVGHPVIARDVVRRLLVVKLDHIGDFIAALPAMRRLKHLFPNAELHVLAARASMSLAKLEPAIDRMHEFNFFNAKSAKGTLKLAQKELVALRERLAPYHFDLALDLRRQGDTRHVLQYTGATWLGGFDRSHQHPWMDLAVDWEGDLARHSKRSHIGDALLQFVEAIGVSCGGDRHVIEGAGTMQEARARIEKLPAVAAIGPVLFARRLVCVHPGAGNENKQWPPGHFAGLIDLLATDQDANIVMIGGPDEVAVAEEVLDSVIHKDRVFMLVGKTRLGDLPDVLRACELYVGNDSGPKHMAAALGVPTVGIHSGSVDASEWGPMGETAVALRRDMNCSPCYLARIADCHRNLACMRGLKPGDVYRACMRLLALGAPGGVDQISWRTES